MNYTEYALKKVVNQQLARQQIATAGYSFYSPFKILPESKYPYYASLCNEACLEINPNARPLYIEVINALRRPGIKTIDSQDNLDYKYLLECVAKYIKHCFNHADYVDNPKITAEKDESIYLISAIIESAAVESQNTTFRDLDVKLNSDNYRVMQLRTDDINNRADRRRREKLAKRAREYKLNLVHEPYEWAKLWYVARVILNNLTIASSLTEYRDENHKIYYLPACNNPGTAFHKIEKFDVATGYRLA